MLMYLGVHANQLRLLGERPVSLMQIQEVSSVLELILNTCLAFQQYSNKKNLFEKFKQRKNGGGVFLKTEQAANDF